MIGPPVSVSLYDAAVAIHVIAVTAAFGVLFAYPWLPKGTSSAHRARERLLAVVVTRSATVGFLVGLYLANDRSYLGEPWVIVPFAIMIVILGTVGTVLGPAERRLGVLSEDDPQRATLERRVEAVAGGCALLVAVAVFFMVTKYGS